MIEQYSPSLGALSGIEAWFPILLVGVEGTSTVLVGIQENARSGAETIVTPSTYTRTPKPPARIISFSDDLYERIQISESLLALGNVVGLQQRQVTFWNAFRRVQPLAAITATGDEGISIAGPTPPISFSVYGEQTYTFTVTTEGPPTIDASFAFDFVPYDLTIAVTGSRVTAWSFRPDWSTPILERLEWRTDVIGAFGGKEQRRALRLAPRKTYEFESFFIGKAKRYAEALLWGWGARPWALPIWPDGSELPGALAPGETQIVMDTATRGYTDDGLAIILADEFTFEVVEIETVEPTRLVLKRGITSAWAATTQIFPAVTARLSDSVNLPRWDHEISSSRVSFAVDEPIDYPATASPTLYRGYPVLIDKPNWTGGFDLEMRRKLAVVDNLVGKRTYEDESGLPATLQRQRWTRVGRAEIDSFRRMLYTLAGRAGPMWVPTWTADLVPVATIFDLSPAIDIEFQGYALQVNVAVGRRDIRIESQAGQVFYRRITGALQLSADTERLQLDTPVGVTLTVSDVRSISFLSLARLDADGIELSHWTGELVESATVFRSFNHDI